MATVASSTVECGYCLQKHEDLDEPKVLPCGHIHCLSCLIGTFEEPKLITCPRCGVVCQSQPSTLADADVTRGKPKQLCDPCTHKGNKKRSATGYCSTCNKKFCDSHVEAHGDMLPDHHLISIYEYNQQAQRFQSRYCTVHTRQSVSLGCKSCDDVLCSKCLDDTTGCPSGGAHQVISLEALAVNVQKKAEKMKQEVRDKGEKFFALSKQSSRTLTEFDLETETIINSLHSTRDEQINFLRRQYDFVEKKISQNRKEAREKIVEFKETVVDVQSKVLSNSMQRVDAGIRDGHPVDLVAGFKDVKQQMDELGADGLPVLSLKDVLQLSKKVQSREIEVEALPTTVTISVMSTEDPIYLKPTKSPMHPLPTQNPKPKAKAPTSLRLIKAVKVSGRCLSVSCQDNITYIGHSSGIDRILDGQMTPLNHLKDSVHRIHGLATKDNIQYSLLHTDQLSSQLRTHDLLKGEVKEFKHMDNTDHIQNITIAGDKVVVPNIAKQCLTIYSLAGKREREIACSQLGTESTAICTLDNDSVIVTAESTRKTFRVNLTSGEIVWTFVHPVSVESVACYGDRFVCVAQSSCPEYTIILAVLDAVTGTFLNYLTDSAKRFQSWVTDLCVNGNTLIVPRYHEKAVLFYEIQ